MAPASAGRRGRSPGYRQRPGRAPRLPPAARRRARGQSMAAPSAPALSVARPPHPPGTPSWMDTMQHLWRDADIMSQPARFQLVCTIVLTWGSDWGRRSPARPRHRGAVEPRPMRSTSACWIYPDTRPTDAASPVAIARRSRPSHLQRRRGYRNQRSPSRRRRPSAWDEVR